MGLLVVTGAMLQCTMGAAPATFAASGVMVQGGTPAGVVTDITMASIPTFGMCMSPANPQVAAATSAALGVLTPQPCLPMIASPWTPGSLKVKISEVPALDSASTCMCTWGGTVTVSSPGQTSITV
ncbi:MAG TPA: DUF4280 domain-containing protein [Gaiellaceae bacterium]|nr:DUF4280 domain-containing protein [Gaiellaceae bacterium]